MSIKYKRNNSQILTFKGGSKQTIQINSKVFEDAAIKAHKVIDQICSFEVNIFEILGMRNLSAFIGELYAASLITATNGDFIKNPHQDGYPDLLLMDKFGQKIYTELKNNGQVREKSPFSPFKNGGIEIKATCGSVPTPERCRRLGLDEKPDIGDQRINVMTGYDWKAHHRETNNLVGILWDFIDSAPRIVAVFFSSSLKEDHWSAIIKPREGGGRTTSVSIMTRAGVKEMYDNWVIVANNDKKYTNFLNSYNRSNSL